VVIALLVAFYTISPPHEEGTVSLIQARGTGPMPILLGTGQIDAYIAWQPTPEVAPLAGIGKVLLYSGDLPPKGKWTNHPCCVFSARQDTIAEHPDLVNAMSALTILSTEYVRENPDKSAEIVADWLAGKGNFTFGDISVSSVEVLRQAFPTVKFVNEPTEKWIEGNIEFVHALRALGVLTDSLANTTDEETIAILFDTGPYSQAKAMIDSGTIITPAPVGKEIGIGYLNSDHDAALFVAVKNWQYFNDQYGIALKPVGATTSRPEKAELMVNGQKVADVRLIPGDAGPQLMQLASTNAIQMAYVGNPPVIAAVDKGTPVKILLAINTEGSGVVVSNESPATDWESFVEWANARSAAGKPLVIAAPGKGSIQDVMIRYSLKESGLSVSEG